MVDFEYLLVLRFLSLLVQAAVSAVIGIAAAMLLSSLVLFGLFRYMAPPPAEVDVPHTLPAPDVAPEVQPIPTPQLEPAAPEREGRGPGHPVS